MGNPTQTNERRMTWVDADTALRAYEDGITDAAHKEDATYGWTARMNEVNKLIMLDQAGKLERRNARLARQNRVNSNADELEMGA